MKKIVSSVLAAAVALSGLAAADSDVFVSDGSAYSTAFAADPYFEGANPVISRGVPAYSDKSDSASMGNDEHYFTSWNASAGDYLAYDLSGVPKEQRKKVLAAWYNLSSYDDLGAYASRNAEPTDYTIEVNKAAGGNCPSAGWETAVTVTGNAQPRYTRRLAGCVRQLDILRRFYYRGRYGKRLRYELRQLCESDRRPILPRSGERRHRWYHQ